MKIIFTKRLRTGVRFMVWGIMRLFLRKRSYLWLTTWLNIVRRLLIRSRDGWLFCLRKIISACGKLSKKRCKGLCRRINLPQRKKRLLLLPRGMLRFCFLKIRMLWRICKGIFLCMPTIFLCGLCSRAVCCSIWFGRLWK